MLLTLPVLSNDVPTSLDLTPTSERHLRLALAMSRLDMIDDDALAGVHSKHVNSRLLCDLMKQGWKKKIAGLYSFDIISAYARLILPDLNDDEQYEIFTAKDGSPLVGIAINASRPEWFAIGKAFSALEDCQPGLGRKGLFILDATLSRFGTSHTPFGVFEMAQMLYWFGEDDESTALQEYGDDTDLPRRNDIFKNIPTWAYDSSNLSLCCASKADFTQAAVNLASHPVGNLICALDHLNSIESENDTFAPLVLEHFDFEYDPYCGLSEPPVVCGWHDADDFSRVYDDNYRNFAESGYELPWAGCVLFAPTEEGIQNALPSIEHTGRVLKALDAVIVEIRRLNHVL